MVLGARARAAMALGLIVGLAFGVAPAAAQETDVPPAILRIDAQFVEEPNLLVTVMLAPNKVMLLRYCDLDSGLSETHPYRSSFALAAIAPNVPLWYVSLAAPGHPIDYPVADFTAWAYADPSYPAADGYSGAGLLPHPQTGAWVRAVASPAHTALVDQECP